MEQEWKFGKVFAIIVILFGMLLDYATPNIPYSFVILAALLEMYIVSYFTKKAEDKGKINDLNDHDQKQYQEYKDIIYGDMDKRERDIYIKPKFNRVIFFYLISFIILPVFFSFMKGSG